MVTKRSKFVKAGLFLFIFLKGGTLLKGLVKLVKGVDSVTLTVTVFFIGTWWTLNRIEGKIDKIRYGLERTMGYHFD